MVAILPLPVATADCRDWLRLQPAGSADAVITDPPYGIGYQSDLYGRIANDARPYVWWLDDAARALRPGGALACFTRWDVAEAWRSAITWAGLTIRSQVVWDRELPGPGDTRRTFAPSHDLIWLATKGDWRLPGRRPRDVLRCRKIRWTRGLHPTPKPVPLMTDLVTALTAPGDLVLDPFAGSGSTGVACATTGRRFAGCEIEPRYADLANRRIAEAAAPK